MSNTEEENTVMTLDITNTSTLNDLFKRLRETDVSNIIDTITFDHNSQTIIFHLQRLLGERVEEFDRQNSATEDTPDTKIKQLSVHYKSKYPELLNQFKEWKPLRQKLLELLGRSANNLERNSLFVSAFRILTSAADILGTLMRYNGHSDNSVANLVMENASVCGVLALFIEMVLNKKIHADVKEAIKKDQEAFEKIVQWFKQTEDLDRTIRSFFPYGIDKNEVAKVDACSGNFNEYQKLFIAVVTSNVKQNVKLFKNKEFLDTAERLATSEAGKLWFHKVLLERDHFFVHKLNSSLANEIQCLMKISPAENRELYVDACRVLSSTIRMKVILNTITIISSGSNLLLADKPPESDVLEKLLKSSREELEKVQSIVLFLNPSGSVVDPVLKD